MLYNTGRIYSRPVIIIKHYFCSKSMNIHMTRNSHIICELSSGFATK